jgi:diacylglycerol O-acyltransferase / wax synthase
LRRANDPDGSNRFTPARFALPIDEPDGPQRMRIIGALAKSWQHEPALARSGSIASVLNWLPVVAITSIFGSLLKAIDFVATNVPGLDHRTYLAGAEVLRQYAFAPTAGSAMSVSLLSHRDQCCIGINTDTAAVPDGDVLVECLRAGFDEVVTGRQ